MQRFSKHRHALEAEIWRVPDADALRTRLRAFASKIALLSKLSISCAEGEAASSGLLEAYGVASEV